MTGISPLWEFRGACLGIPSLSRAMIQIRSACWHNWAQLGSGGRKCLVSVHAFSRRSSQSSLLHSSGQLRLMVGRNLKTGWTAWGGPGSVQWRALWSPHLSGSSLGWVSNPLVIPQSIQLLDSQRVGAGKCMTCEEPSCCDSVFFSVGKLKDPAKLSAQTFHGDVRGSWFQSPARRHDELPRLLMSWAIGVSNSSASDWLRPPRL